MKNSDCMFYGNDGTLINTVRIRYSELNLFLYRMELCPLFPFKACARQRSLLKAKLILLCINIIYRVELGKRPFRCLSRRSTPKEYQNARNGTAMTLVFVKRLKSGDTCQRCALPSFLNSVSNTAWATFSHKTRSETFKLFYRNPGAIFKRWLSRKV